MAPDVENPGAIQGEVMFYPLPVRPFQGSLCSCAFSVLDKQAFGEDPGIASLRDELDLMQDRSQDESGQLYCFVRDMEPGAPLVVSRAFGLVLMDDQAELARIDDNRGWVAALQRHLDPDHVLVVQEYLNPDAPGKDLLWVILPEAAVCGIGPAESKQAYRAFPGALRKRGAGK